MFIRFFGKKFFIQYAVLFLLTVVLWGDVLLEPSVIRINTNDNGFFGLAGFFNQRPLLMVIGAIFLLYFQAIVINQIAENHRLTERNRLLTAAMYVVAVSSNSAMTNPIGILFTGLLLIILLNIVLNIYGRKEPYRHVFDAGLLIGIASMIYFPVIYFLVFVWLCLMLFQIFTWREWVIPVIGLAIPYLFAGTWFFWTDTLFTKLTSLKTPFTGIQPLIYGSNVFIHLVSGLLVLLIFVSTINILREIYKNTLTVRKKLRVLFVFLFVALIIQLPTILGVKTAS
jgi:hypothetical protein